MSGIAGLIRFDGGPIEPGLIETMTESMAHRGPDGLRYWSRGSVALGHCMLRTTPESLEETQPLANEDESVVLVMDGRVDNWEELRAELVALGARLRTRADAELVLRAYERWGQDCVHHMDGDFALVIWDERRREAICARDRMGHKPFHYHWDGKRLAIASELHAILALPSVEAELNEGYVAEHLADQVISRDATFWQGVLRLPPAHRMVADGCPPRVVGYWLPDFESRLVYRDGRDYYAHYRALLDEAVRRQSRAYTPLAFEVSGGLDSSAGFAVAEVLARQGRLLAAEMHGYTLAFNGGAAGRDLAFARAVGQHLGRQLHEVPPRTQPLAWYRGWARRYRDCPSPPHGVMQTGIYAAALENGSRVILGGDGGDHWLTGDYAYYADTLVDVRPAAFWQDLMRDTRAMGPRRALFLAGRYGIIPILPVAVRRLSRGMLERLRRQQVSAADFLSTRMRRILAERSASHRSALCAQARPGHRSKLGLLLGGDMAFDTELMERLAASYGMEIRSPLNSAPLVQFGFSAPQGWLLRYGWNKFTHRNALRDVLPTVVIDRKDKAEFSIVLRNYETELRENQRKISKGPVAWVSSDATVAGGSEEEDSTARLLRLWRLFACDAVRVAAKVSTTSNVA